MPSLRELPAVRRLNAPTRAAATRRRRLRKGIAALCAALAVLMLFSPRGSGASRNAGAPPLGDTSALRGRHLVSLPVEPALAAALHEGSRVDVWEPNGRPVARNAPVALPKHASGHGGGGRFGSGGDPPSQVLVAFADDDVARIARHSNGTDGDHGAFLLTLAP